MKTYTEYLKENIENMLNHYRNVTGHNYSVEYHFGDLESDFYEADEYTGYSFNPYIRLHVDNQKRYHKRLKNNKRLQNLIEKIETKFELDVVFY